MKKVAMKTMQKTINTLFILVLTISLMAGCASVGEVPDSSDTGIPIDYTAPGTTEPASDAEAGTEEHDSGDFSDIKIAMVSDTAGINDQAFNQSAWEGMQKTADSFGVRISYKESTQNADYIPNLETMYYDSNDLIWGIGFSMADAILEAARNNPDQNYAIIDAGGWEDTPPNLLGVSFKAEDSGFLVGYIAGKMTETDMIGFVGGMSMPTLWQFECGFRAGVRYANPNADVNVQYAESFTDVAKGKSIATGMFVQGVDIIFHAAAGLGDGVIEAAREQGKWAIGVDRDQNYLAPDNVLTSAMKRVDNALYNVNKDLIEGNFQGGRTIVYGLTEGAVGIAPSSDKNVPAHILSEVDEVEQRIINGEITVPGDYEALDAFFASMN